jgi:hypothetical protein
MKRALLILEAVFSVCIMMSVVTAVPQTNSSPVMDAVHEIERSRTEVDEKIAAYSSLDVQPNGIIDLLKQLIWMIIQAVLDLIDIIRNLIGLVALIEYLINLVMILVEAVMALIEFIMDLFNPSVQVA